VEKVVWLEEIALSCSMTLRILNKKAEEQGFISDSDQIMNDVCMGYLYLLNVCDSTGALEQYPEQKIGTVLNRTLH
jgi:hypothetical protein